MTVRNELVRRLVHVATVRLAGEVIGLTFFAFDNTVAFVVPPHTTVTNRYSIPLVGLNGQATGLIEGSVVGPRPRPAGGRFPGPGGGRARRQLPPCTACSVSGWPC